MARTNRKSKSVLSVAGWLSVWSLLSIGWCGLVVLLDQTIAASCYEKGIPGAPPIEGPAFVRFIVSPPEIPSIIGVFAIAVITLSCWALRRRGYDCMASHVLCFGIAILFCLQVYGLGAIVVMFVPI